MKPGFIEGLIGSWPGALLLGGFGVVASLTGILIFQQQPVSGVVCMVAGILSVKHAVRARARVAHMREFGRQWARVAGWDEPPTRGVKGWLWWGIKSLAFFALAGACAGVSFMLWGDSPIEKGRSDFVVIFWVLFATLLGVMFRRHIYAFWLARKERKRRYEEGSEVDGKHLPRQFVEQALSAPMRSPGAAWFTQELPEYCIPLLTKRAEAGALSGADDDSIEDAADSAPPAEQKPRFAIQTKAVAQAALLVVVGGLAAVLQPYLSPFLDKLKGRETAPAVADAPLQGSNTPPVPDRVEFMRWAMRVLGQSQDEAALMWEDAKAGGEHQMHFSSFYAGRDNKAASAWAQFTAARGGITTPVPPQQQSVLPVAVAPPRNAAADAVVAPTRTVAPPPAPVQTAKATQTTPSEQFKTAPSPKSDEISTRDLAKILAKARNLALSDETVEEVELALRLAKQGNASAQAGIGSLYKIAGLRPQAERWLSLAAAQGEKDAEDALLAMRSTAAPVQSATPRLPETPRAVETKPPPQIATTATAQQSTRLTEKQSHELYLQGFQLGMNKEHEKAVALYLQAAESGNARAMAALSNAYWAGEGVPKDRAKALDWLRRAANLGNSQSQYLLGEVYERGLDGVAVNAEEASKWYRLAAARGDSRAVAALEKMQK